MRRIILETAIQHNERSYEWSRCELTPLIRENVQTVRFGCCSSFKPISSPFLPIHVFGCRKYPHLRPTPLEGLPCRRIKSDTPGNIEGHAWTETQITRWWRVRHAQSIDCVPYFNMHGVSLKIAYVLQSQYKIKSSLILNLCDHSLDYVYDWML